MSAALLASELASSDQPRPSALSASSSSSSRQAFLSFNLLAVRNLFEATGRPGVSGQPLEKSTSSGGGSKAGVVWGSLQIKSRKNFKPFKDSPSLLIDSVAPLTAIHWTSQTGVWTVNVGDAKAVRVSIFVQFSEPPATKHEVGWITLALPLVANTQQPRWEPLELAPGLREAAAGVFNCASSTNTDECPAVLFTASFFDRSGVNPPESPSRTRLSMSHSSSPHQPPAAPSPVPPSSSPSLSSPTPSPTSSSSSLSTTAAELVRFRRELGVADDVECRGSFKVKLVNNIGKQKGDLVVFATCVGFVPESSRHKTRFCIPMESIAAIDFSTKMHVHPRIKLRQVDGSSFKVIAVKHLPKLLYERLDALWRAAVSQSPSAAAAASSSSSLRDPGSTKATTTTTTGQQASDTEQDASESFSSDESSSSDDDDDSSSNNDDSQKTPSIASRQQDSAQRGSVPSVSFSSSSAAASLTQMRTTGRLLPPPSCPAFDAPYNLDEIRTLIFADERRDLYLKELVEAFGLSSPLAMTEWRHCEAAASETLSRDIAFTKQPSSSLLSASSPSSSASASSATAASPADCHLPKGAYELHEVLTSAASHLKFEALLIRPCTGCPKKRFVIYTVVSVLAYSDRADSSRIDVRFCMQHSRRSHHRKRLDSAGEAFVRHFVHALFLRPDRREKAALVARSMAAKTDAQLPQRQTSVKASSPAAAMATASSSPRPRLGDHQQPPVAAKPANMPQHLDPPATPPPVVEGPSVRRVVTIVFGIQLLVVVFFLLRIFSLESRIAMLETDLASAFELIDTISIQQLSKIDAVLRDHAN